jgi:hypothetical protein
MGLLRKIRSRLDHAWKNDVYELRGSEILRGRARRPGDRLLVKDVKEWHIYPEMGFDVVIINLVNGEQARWIDVYGDLISILREVAADTECQRA